MALVAGAGTVEPLPGDAAAAARDARAGAERLARPRPGPGLGLPRAPARHRRLGQRHRGEPEHGKPAEPRAVRAAAFLPQRRLRPRLPGQRRPLLHRAHAQPARWHETRGEAAALRLRSRAPRERRAGSGAQRVLRSGCLCARYREEISAIFRMGRFDSSLSQGFDRCTESSTRRRRARSEVAAIEHGHRSCFAQMRQVLSGIKKAKPAVDQSCGLGARGDRP